MERPETLDWTEHQAANRLLAANDLALLVGMLLDQQFPMERAFLGPHLLEQRLDVKLDAATLLSLDPDSVEDAFRGPPAVHRFPNAMAGRTLDLCRTIVAEYGGRPAAVWEEADSALDLRRRLEALPGYGRAKARIFVGILAKRMGIRPQGWEREAADWASIADVESFADIAELRERKRKMKRQQQRKAAHT